ncbi:collagen triple helix repeat protein [Salmonella phage 19]|nr:collagen triple helix repeat protein [Salmonella phage 19]
MTGPEGPQGPQGPEGQMGAGVEILGKLDNTTELPSQEN